MQTEKVVDYIVNWLKDYAVGAKMEGFVIGISGGIDSAVTSTLCARTGLELLCLEMPIHQASSQISRALNHINWLKSNYTQVSMKQIELTPVLIAWWQHSLQWKTRKKDSCLLQIQERG